LTLTKTEMSYPLEFSKQFPHVHRRGEFKLIVMQNCYPLTAVGVYFQVFSARRPLKIECFWAGLKTRIENGLLVIHFDVFECKNQANVIISPQTTV